MSKSSLISDLQVEQQVCKFVRIVNNLKDKDEQKALHDAISLIRQETGNGIGRRYTSMWLVRIMKKNAIDVSPSTIQRHVNKECSCVEHSE